MATLGNATDNSSVGMALDWDASIKDTGPVREIVPEGEYSFEVTGFTRDTFPGSEKLPSCPWALMDLELVGKDGKRYSAFTEIKLCEKLIPLVISPFFRSIGQLDKGGEITMDWNAVPGSKGRVRVTIYEYEDSSGKKRQKNNFMYIAPKDGVSNET